MTRSGISAANGAVCITTKIGETSQSNFLLSPTQRPIPMPKIPEIKTPNTRGFKVSAYATNKVPSMIKTHKANIDYIKVVMANLTGTRPAISHVPKTSNADRHFNRKDLWRIIITSPAMVRKLIKNMYKRT